MKKTIIIILALVLILVGGIWLYLLLFGAPESAEDIFADLGFGGEPAPVVPINTDPTPDPVDPVVPEERPEMSSERLMMLSSIPSVGSVVVGSTTNNQKVRFVEQGIGNVYEINFLTNQETKISDTIFNGISSAVWSTDGNYVILIKDAAVNREVTLFDLTSGNKLQENAGIHLPPDAQNIDFVSETVFKYTRSDTEGTLGYEYDATTGKSSVVFSVPFTSVGMSWSEQTVIYNRPSELHPGYAYVLREGNHIEGIGGGGIGLTALGSDTSVVVSKEDENGRFTGFTTSADKPEVKVAIPLLPEKCTVVENKNDAWCGYPFGNFRGEMPNDWYKGLLATNDDLWKVDLSTGSAQVVEDLEIAAGSSLDVINMNSDITGVRFVFNDLNTHALWLYDTTK